MNKTIHELNSLSEAEATDEMIVYDVSSNESKKIPIKNLVGSYSETETLTGATWIDGKPIYRRTIKFTHTANSASIQQMNVNGIDFMIKIKYVTSKIDTSNRNYQFFEQGNWDGYWVKYFWHGNNKQINLEFGNDLTSRNFDLWVTIEYTKSS